MSMRKLLSGFAIVALLIPIAVSAATAEELAAQIKALLEQVAALQQQVGAGPTPSLQTGTGAASGGTLQCPRVSRVLRRGASGADVTRLQQFLALDPSVYPEAQVTGYYGALTEAAVKKFQCKNKLVCDGSPESTGYGVTGPRTAALLALQCPDFMGGGDTPSGFMRVTPTQGAAPLNVQVEVILNTVKACTAQTFEVYFGDASQPMNVTVPVGFCNELRQVLNHTYTSGGSYTLTLRSGVHQNNVIVIVSGGSGQASIFAATPTGGPAPLTVQFNGIRNAMNICNAGRYTVDFGDGQTTSLSDPGCTSSPFSLSHLYANNGNFIARFYRDAAQNDASSVSIAVGSASGGGGPFTVTAGANGDPYQAAGQFEIASSCARYDLDWGDGTAHATQAEGSCAAGSVSKTVNHTYQTAGSYTITLKRGSTLNVTDTVSLVIVN